MDRCRATGSLIRRDTAKFKFMSRGIHLDYFANPKLFS